MRNKSTKNFFARTVLCLFYITISVNGLLRPTCKIDKENPQLGEAVTLTCQPNINDSRENITLSWFHNGHNISTEQRSGKIRIVLSIDDYGKSYYCKEADGIDETTCTLMPLPLIEVSSEPPTNSTPTKHINTAAYDSKDPRQDTIMILFIAIVVAGGLPILCSIIGCIVWISRKTKKSRSSYTLQERPRLDSFDDFDTEAAVDQRPAAPLPGEVKAMNVIKASSLKSSTKNGTPPVLKSLTERESCGPEYYAPPAEIGSDNMYQNTAMGTSATLPGNTTTPKNHYLVPNCNTNGSNDSLDDMIYENTPSKQKRFEAGQTASLPSSRY